MKIETTEPRFGSLAEASGPVAVSGVSAIGAIGRQLPSGVEAYEAQQANNDDNVDPAMLGEAAAALDDYFSQREPALNFRVDDESGRLVISLVDPGSGEVLRQIPSEEALHMAKALQDGEPPLLDQRA